MINSGVVLNFQNPLPFINSFISHASTTCEWSERQLFAVLLEKSREEVNQRLRSQA